MGWNAQVEVEGNAHVKVEASVHVEAEGYTDVEVDASAPVEVEASVHVEVEASDHVEVETSVLLKCKGMFVLKLKGGFVLKFSGLFVLNLEGVFVLKLTGKAGRQAQETHITHRFHVIYAGTNLYVNRCCCLHVCPRQLMVWRKGNQHPRLLRRSERSPSSPLVSQPEACRLACSFNVPSVPGLNTR